MRSDDGALHSRYQSWRTQGLPGTELLIQADRVVGGGKALLVIDDIGTAAALPWEMVRAGKCGEGWPGTPGTSPLASRSGTTVPPVLAFVDRLFQVERGAAGDGYEKPAAATSITLETHSSRRLAAPGRA